MATASGQLARAHAAKGARGSYSGGQQLYNFIPSKSRFIGGNRRHIVKGDEPISTNFKRVPLLHRSFSSGDPCGREHSLRWGKTPNPSTWAERVPALRRSFGRSRRCFATSQR